MKKTDVFVIGSSAAGLVAATIGKTIHPEKSYSYKKKDKTLIPCGIPYVFGSVEKTENNILPAADMFSKVDVEYEMGTVASILRSDKICVLENGEKISYDKLVIATGSTPMVPGWLKGADKKNVFSVPKDKQYLDEMQKGLKDAKRIITVGAGFIGVELSDELNKIGAEVTLVEKLPHVLGLAFDVDVAEIVEDKLKERGVKVIKGIGVKEILGEEKVTGILLENGEKIQADAVVLTMGYYPNSKLASDAGLSVSNKGFIKVDEYMRTEDPDIFAVGDCAEKRDFITRRPNPIMLASTACAEGRTAGMNLFKLSAIKTFSGTISIFASALGDTGFGVAGLTETRAIEEGFDIITGTFKGINRHPGKLSDTHEQIVKLIVGKESGIILGGEVLGGLEVGELTNTIGFIIQNRMDVYTLMTSQIGTHPLLTASPAGYPLLKAAEIVMKKKQGLIN